MNNIDFVNLCISKHGDKYDYSLISDDIKIKVICKIHGEFEIDRYSFKYGHGCKTCSKELMSNKLKQNKSSLIADFIKVHGNRYGYDLVEYVNSKTNIRIVCKIHGEFLQKPAIHKIGQGCPKCANNTKSNNLEFIQKANIVHNTKYDYSSVEYVNNSSKVKIKCNIHGIFEQSPNDHLNGYGCPKCAGRNKTKDSLINEFRGIHGNKYSYDKVELVSYYEKVIITCNKHGDFKQTYNKHLLGRGCPKCRSSIGENKILKYLEDNKIEYISEYYDNNCRYKLPLPFDFRINIGKVFGLVEFNGGQHYHPVRRFGGEKSFEITKIRDEIKYKFCKDNNIPLLIIKYTEINKIEDLLEHFIKDLEKLCI